MRSLTVTNANGQSLTSGPILGIGTFWGKNANDSFGQGAAGVGDVNGDGFDDVVVTAAGATVNGIIQAGVAYLYLGQPNGLASVPAWTYSGAQAYEKFGEDVRGLGDINHDGFADIAIGSDVETAADDTVGHGKVTIILGSISGLQPQPHVVLTDTVDPTDSRFGAREHTIAAGDFNGDGWIDLVIGAETFSNGAGQASEGAVHLYLSQGGNFASTPSRTWESNQGNSRLGRFLSMADVNRDGYADVIAAMHAFDVVPCAEPTNGCNQGRLVAYLGRPGSPPTTFAWNNSSPVQTLATLGYGVSAGDIDGDGFPEIAAGAPLWDQSNLPDCGTLVIYKGSQNLATTPLQTITGPFAGDRFGGSLAFVGDMDSDGFGELAVSAQAAEAGRGRVVVFRGSPTGLLPSPLMTFVGDVGAAWGQTLSAAGDVDGDSKPDWLIGSSDADTRGQSSGAVSIVLSSVNQLCDSIDFNNDTSLFDPQDIDAFLSVYSEGPCIPASATCNDIDFNNDGSLFDPCDIDAFLLVFSEGPCTLCGQ
ncbi:MAG: FG-GAP-like repeat-containing protein [Phycisphaerales bacterium]